jgi:hypothetical protein
MVAVQHFGEDVKQVIDWDVLIYVDGRKNAAPNPEKHENAAHLYPPNKPHPRREFSSDGHLLAIRTTSVGKKGLSKQRTNMYMFWDGVEADAEVQLSQSSVRDVDIFQQNWHHISLLRRLSTAVGESVQKVLDRWNDLSQALGILRLAAVFNGSAKEV